MPSEATDCQELASELIEVCTTLYDNFDDFIVSQQIDIGTNLYPGDWSLAQIRDADVHERLDFEEVTLEGDDGVRLGELMTAINRSASDRRYVPSVSFERNRVLVTLESGERYVDRTDGVVEYIGTDFVDRAPSTDPLSLQVRHAPTITIQKSPLKSTRNFSSKSSSGQKA